MTSDVVISATNERWKEVSKFGGEDFDLMGNLFRGADSTANIYTFRDSNYVLLTVDMKKKIIDLDIQELHKHGYKLQNKGLATIIQQIAQERRDMELKVAEYRWAMGEIAGMLDRIKTEWNTSRWWQSGVGEMLSKLEEFVRSKR